MFIRGYRSLVCDGVSTWDSTPYTFPSCQDRKNRSSGKEEKLFGEGGGGGESQDTFSSQTLNPAWSDAQISGNKALLSNSRCLCSCQNDAAQWGKRCYHYLNAKKSKAGFNFANFEEFEGFWLPYASQEDFPILLTALQVGRQ